MIEDPFSCYSTNRKNSRIQQNWRNQWRDFDILWDLEYHTSLQHCLFNDFNTVKSKQGRCKTIMVQRSLHFWKYEETFVRNSLPNSLVLLSLWSSGLQIKSIVQGCTDCTTLKLETCLPLSIHFQERLKTRLNTFLCQKMTINDSLLRVSITQV